MCDYKLSKARPGLLLHKYRRCEMENEVKEPVYRTQNSEIDGECFSLSE